MNNFLLKNVILIAGILGTTAMVAGPVQNAISGGSADNISADSIYQFGSGLFYKEISKPGNEYMQSSVEGYSTNLIQSDQETANFNARWQEGVSTFKAGYADCMDAYLMLATVPSIPDQAGKNAPWELMRTGKENIARSADLLTAAKSHASPGSSDGFTIGMVLPRIDEIEQNAVDAELASMKATLADRDHDQAGFDEHLKEAGNAIKEMKRIYPELTVLSSDFS
ncbi:MAG TPA: hypothetical protein VMS81_00305 [Methanomicrobiales archaeon]|nr:hypothetical protein [Methanomicrobiales archaeon]